MGTGQAWRAFIVVTALAGTGAVGSGGAAAASTAGHRPPVLLYTGLHGLRLRTSTGSVRTLSATNPTALAWSPDGTKVGWLTASQQVRLASLTGGPTRSWKCRTCDTVAFQGETLVAGSFAGKPHLLRYPSGGGAPASVAVTGLPASRFPENNIFVLLSTTPSGQLIAGYGIGVSAYGGPQDLYRIGVKGKAAPFAPVKKQVVSNTIPHGFTYSGNGASAAFVLTGHGGICANSDFVVLAKTASGAESRPAMPKGLVYVGYDWFNASGTPYMSLVHAPSHCGTKSVTIAPKDYRLAGKRWVPAGSGVIDAAYNSGWQAVLTGKLISSPLGLDGQVRTTLTVTHGPARHVVAGVAYFTWLP